MQIHSDSGVDPLLTLEGISIFPLFLFSFHFPPQPTPFTIPWPLCFPHPLRTCRKGVCFSAGGVLDLPQLVRAEPASSKRISLQNFRICCG